MQRGIVSCVLSGLCGLAFWGCGSDGTPGTSACSGPAACGGTLDGTWQVDGVCVEGDLVAALNGMTGLPPACSTVFKSAALSGSGSVVFANGVETDNVTQTVTATAIYTSACVSAVAGTTIMLNASVCSSVEQMIGGSASCEITNGNCSCSVTVESSAPSTKEYVVSGTDITYSNGDDPISYCVAGSTFTARQVASDLPGVTLVFTAHKAG